MIAILVLQTGPGYLNEVKFITNIFIKVLIVVYYAIMYVPVHAIHNIQKGSAVSTKARRGPN